jgi:hypothetical protein
MHDAKRFLKMSSFSIPSCKKRIRDSPIKPSVQGRKEENKITTSQKFCGTDSLSPYPYLGAKFSHLLTHPHSRCFYTIFIILYRKMFHFYSDERNFLFLVITQLHTRGRVGIEELKEVERERRRENR